MIHETVPGQGARTETSSSLSVVKMDPGRVLALGGYSALELRSSLRFNVAQGPFLAAFLRCHPLLESKIG